MKNRPNLRIIKCMNSTIFDRIKEIRLETAGVQPKLAELPDKNAR
jgi:hypothetical protein